MLKSQLLCYARNKCALSNERIVVSATKLRELGQSLVNTRSRGTEERVRQRGNVSRSGSTIGAFVGVELEGRAEAFLICVSLRQCQRAKSVAATWIGESCQ